MKAVLITWGAATVVSVLLALWWGYFARPRLHRAAAPGSAMRAARPCAVCGHIPYYEAPDCTRCGGTGFVTINEEEQHG